MPVTKSAKKALRVDRRRTVVNRKIREKLRVALKEARQDLSKTNIEKAQSVLDRAAKKNVIHKNKASRLKSRLVAAAKKTKPKAKK